MMKFAVKVMIGVASAGALAATGMAIGAIPNPFAHLQEEAARHRVHEMKVRWHHDGKLQTIPILEQGWPFEDGKYFNLKPVIAANPIKPEGIFKFDHEIEQYANFNGVSGTMRYKVNSTDNSMYMHGVDILENPAFAKLKNSTYLRKNKLDFIIRNAQDDWLLYMTHRSEGKIVVTAPSGFSYSNVFTDTYLVLMEFLNSTKENSTYSMTSNALEPYTGKITDMDGRQKELTVWFAKEEARIATGVPFMGFGVGILKNPLEKKQQFLAIAELEDMVFKLLDLQTIEEWGINTGGYREITFDFHLPSGQERINDLTTWFMAKQAEIASLREQMKECPGHQAGKACREEYRRQVKAIQEELEEKAKELGQKMLPPLE